MKKTSSAALAILVLLVAALAFLQTPLMSQVRGATWNSWSNVISKTVGLGDINTSQTVIDQNAGLRAENARLQAELIDYRRLRQQLGSPAVADLRAVPAAVVSRPLDTFSSQYVLNKGLAQGLTRDAPVVINGSVLVGFITDISANTSILTTLLSPRTQITVEISNPDAEALPARGLLQSRQYTSLIVTTIPRDVTLAVDQTVVTVAKDRNLPYGLVVGSVASIISPENEAYQSARLRLPYDPDLIDAVHVLVSP